MVVLIGVLLVRLADSLCLCLGLNFLESILGLFASFIEEIHNCHQKPSKVCDISWIFAATSAQRSALCFERSTIERMQVPAAHVIVSPGIISRNGSRVCCQELMKWQTVQ
jgi:hypothetical protein